MCRKVTVSMSNAVRGSTLQASLLRVGLLKPGQMEMRPEGAEDMERVLLCATRIS